MLRSLASRELRELLSRSQPLFSETGATILLKELSQSLKTSYSCSLASSFSSAAISARGSSLTKATTFIKPPTNTTAKLPSSSPRGGGRNWAPLPRRYASSNVGERVQNVIKAVAAVPRAAAQTTHSLLPASARRFLDSLQQPSSLQRAISLQLEAAWQRHRIKALGLTLLGLTYLVWRAMRKTASAFVDVSQSMAATGLISLGAALSFVAAVFWYRKFFTISPSAVYRAATRQLNIHPGILEIMGAPLVGSDVRATVLTGGGLKFKGFRPKLRSRRVAMIFPLKGTERRGLVSVEAKKKGGAMKMTLLAVDVPMPQALGGEQRLYIVGGPAAYSRGSVLDELRRPFLAALSSEEAVEAEEEAEEEREERQAALNNAIAEREVVEGSGRGGSGAAAGTGPAAWAEAPEVYSKAAAAARDFLSKVQQVTKRQ